MQHKGFPSLISTENDHSTKTIIQQERSFGRKRSYINKQLSISSHSAEDCHSFKTRSFNCQNVTESGHLKDFIDHFVDMDQLHLTLLVHDLLSRQKDAQTC